ERVVMLEILVDAFRGIWPQSEVAACDKAGFARSACLLPGCLCRFVACQGHLGTASTANEAIAPTGNAFYRDRRVSANQHLGATWLCWWWTYRADILSERFTGPGALHDYQLLVEELAALMKWRWSSFE